VNNIGATVCLDVLQHIVGELWNDINKVVFGHVRIARRNVHHSVIWLYQDFCRKVVTPRTRIRGAIDTRVSKTRHKLANVHVHTTTVADSGLCEWRRVKRENGYATHA